METDEIERINDELSEHEFFAELEAGWRETLPHLSDTEWLLVFPEARQILPEKLKEWVAEKKRLIDIAKKYLRASAGDTYWYLWASLHMSVIPKIEAAAKHIARIQRQIRHTSSGNGNKGYITETDIKRAKEVPIESLLSTPIRRTGKTITANCPLHTDHSPSFVIYTETNTCWCFGCQEGGDSIALVRKLYKFDFIGSVKYLLRV
jgi:hypothetical protein